MISIPGLTDSGMKTKKLVELVDLFPTLVEAAGYDPLPLCPEKSQHITLCRDGSSLLPLFHDPDRDDWKSAAFWQYPRGDKLSYNVPSKMGYAIRTERYRYTEWVHIKHLSKYAYEPNWGRLIDSELYDLEKDPQENINL